ncbi:MAG: dephospho-CoA kinase [Prevotella sp.]|nr:dephospho-CoA kinase [Prevotella sp.]
MTALTGGIGSGKSFVASLLRKRGIEVYDCDSAAKQLMRESTELQKQLSALIGKSVFDDGQLNKRAIAEFLLESEGNKQAVNNIVHPAVARDFEQSGLSWIESAILFESRFNERIHIDCVICVTAPRRVRIRRIMERDNITADQARQWVDRQTPQRLTAQRSDYIIVNDGIENVEEQLETIMKTMTINDDEKR